MTRPPMMEVDWCGQSWIDSSEKTNQQENYLTGATGSKDTLEQQNVGFSHLYPARIV